MTISIKSDGFVPPVIIGSVQKGDIVKDIILDGQQRLTSVLFAYIGKYLDIKKYCDKHKDMPTERFDGEEEDDDELKHQVGQWTFNEIVTDNGKYDRAKTEKEWFVDFADLLRIEKTFFNKHYMGFCYIVRR